MMDNVSDNGTPLERLLGACRTITGVQNLLNVAMVRRNEALSDLDEPEDEHMDARFEKLARDIEALHSLMLDEWRKAGGSAED